MSTTRAGAPTIVDPGRSHCREVLAALACASAHPDRFPGDVPRRPGPPGPRRDRRRTGRRPTRRVRTCPGCADATGMRSIPCANNSGSCRDSRGRPRRKPRSVAPVGAGRRARAVRARPTAPEHTRRPAPAGRSRSHLSRARLAGDRRYLCSAGRPRRRTTPSGQPGSSPSRSTRTALRKPATIR